MFKNSYIFISRYSIQLAIQLTWDCAYATWPTTFTKCPSGFLSSCKKTPSQKPFSCTCHIDIPKLYRCYLGIKSFAADLWLACELPSSVRVFAASRSMPNRIDRSMATRLSSHSKKERTEAFATIVPMKIYGEIVWRSDRWGVPPSPWICDRGAGEKKAQNSCHRSTNQQVLKNLSMGYEKQNILTNSYLFLLHY